MPGLVPNHQSNMDNDEKSKEQSERKARRLGRYVRVIDGNTVLKLNESHESFEVRFVDGWDVIAVSYSGEYRRPGLRSAPLGRAL